MDITGKIISNSKLNDYAHHLSVKLTEPVSLDFAAGQFLMVEVGQNQKRAYSIANSESQKDLIEFIIDTRPGGLGSQFGLQAKPDDIVKMAGPFGHLKVTDTPAPKIFLANGCGIPPMKSMIETMLEQKRPEKIILLWGMRFFGDLYLEERFETLEQIHPNFMFKICISRPEHENDREYCTFGHVTDALCLSEIKQHVDAEYYMCGKIEMIKEVTDELKKRGIGTEKIFSEGY